MTDVEVSEAVSREDALKFCGAAMRNWQHLSFDEDELEDLRAELERFRLQSITHLEQENAALQTKLDAVVAALQWYGEPVLTYAITQANEPRSAVHGDGGRRAREALKGIGAPETYCDARQALTTQTEGDA